MAIAQAMVLAIAIIYTSFLKRILGPQKALYLMDLKWIYYTDKHQCKQY